MLYWGMFLIGLLFHLLLQVHRSVTSGSNGLDGIDGAKKWLRLQAVPVLLRWFLSVLMFGYWRDNPDSLSRVATAVPVTWYWCGLIGFAGDEFLDKVLAMIIPGMKIDIPKIVPPDPAEAVALTPKHS